MASAHSRQQAAGFRPALNINRYGQGFASIRLSLRATLHEIAMSPSRQTFPAPDHDHDRCTADAIDHAVRVCERRSRKFTPIRRQVLQALLSSHRPLGAYEVID